MSALLKILKLLLGAAPWAMTRGTLLAILTLLMGAGLLGLSGWFITATGIAGLAGIGIAFDVFRPSAGVRALALGRTAGRYGERLLTHDATLRALAALRVALLRAQSRLGARALSKLRSEGALLRIVADVDALDGVVLRLFLPTVAGIVTHIAVFAFLAAVTDWTVALVVLLGYVPAATLILWFVARRSLKPSARSEAHSQTLWRGAIDMLRDREALILSGTLGDQEEKLIASDRALRDDAERLDWVERDGDALLLALVTIVAGLALLAGGWLYATGALSPALAAIGVFVALALSETVLPLRRGFSDLGRMIDAATRVQPDVELLDAPQGGTPDAKAPLLSVDRPGLRFSLAGGETAALTGPSGSGKSTLLLQIAGLAEGDGIALRGLAPAEWDEAGLRDLVTMLPQRSILIAGSVRENLSLAAPYSDAEMWQALEAVDLAEALRQRDNLETRLGEGGRGLSGGQARRLALARAILKRPQILLLDEPNEGLDAETSTRVLAGLRQFLPQTAILAALHRGAEDPLFATQYKLSA